MKEHRLCRIGICQNESNWHVRIREELETKTKPGQIELMDIKIDNHDWIEKVIPCDALIWKPHNMGPLASGYLKEKIFFIEHYLGKLVIPNFNTIWHFESKAAQSYLFNFAKISTPKTFVSFDLEDSLAGIENAEMPIVTKKSYGAASSNVRLIQNVSEASKCFHNIMAQQFCKKKLPRGWRSANIFRFLPMYLRTLFQSRIQQINQNCVYWQEFIPGNNRDLRITVIGDRYAFAFWRNNRPGDFRASGSGRIDYSSPIPEEALRYCLRINRTFDFDSMAYDLVFKDGTLQIVEMSYGYIDTAIYNTPGHYRFSGDTLSYVEGHIWPQQAWVWWLLHRMETRHA